MTDQQDLHHDQVVAGATTGLAAPSVDVTDDRSAQFPETRERKFHLRLNARHPQDPTFGCGTLDVLEQR